MRTLNRKWKIFIYALSMCGLAMLNFVRIFNMVYWLDEVFSIRLAQMDFRSLIEATAADVHPPLYYIVLRAGYLLLGDHGYTYHLVSVIPVILLIVFSATVIRKRYGYEISFLFSLFSTCLESCLRYNREVRMYAMAYLFVFLCYWYGMELLFEKEKPLNWILLTLNGILAAYTHYYALVAVAFVLATVYIMILVKKGLTHIWKCILSGIICIAAYLPWLRTLLESMERETTGESMTTLASVRECIDFIFGANIFSLYIKCVMLVGCVLCAIRWLNRYLHAGVEPKKQIHLCWIKDLFRRREIINIVVAGISIAGTTCFGTVLSLLTEPLFITRYLFVAEGMLALCMAVIIGKAFPWHRFSIAIVVVAAVLGLYTWTLYYQNEVRVNEGTKESVEFIRETIAYNEIIICSNYMSKAYGPFSYYFDFYNIWDYYGYGDDYLQRTTWLFYEGTLEESFTEQIEAGGGVIEFIYSGNIGDYVFNLYKIYPQ